MAILKPAKMGASCLKFGIYGDAGSGKSFTATLVAIGLHKYIKSQKPIAYYDSEGGSDYLLHIYEKEGVELLVAKSDSFSDLKEFTREAIKRVDIAIVDSVSLPWDELQKAYMKKHHLDQIRHWAHWKTIKAKWREDFSDIYLEAPIHFLVCGRAGIVLEEVEDDQGIKELKQTGMRMRVEKELGYEPSLLVELEKVRSKSTGTPGWVHRAWVAKDRFDLLDGKHFDEPTFESFLPHIEKLNIGGKHKPRDTKQTSEEEFQRRNWGDKYFKLHDQLLDKIKITLEQLYPGRSDTAVNSRRDICEEIFGSKSWEEIKDVDLFNNEILQVGYEKLSAKLKERQGEGEETDA